jgi:hypothetical protein
MFSVTNKAIYLMLVLYFCLMIPNLYSSEIKPIVIEPDEMAGRGQLMEQTSLSKPFKWGNDVLISDGDVSGGITATYDDSGYLYAARCTTYSGTERNSIRIYRSTNGGMTWQPFWGFAIMDYHPTMPVLLTGQHLTNNWLYILYLVDVDNGNIGIARVKIDSLADYNFYSVASGPDTITYFSACADFETGSHLMVAYQQEEGWHRLYTIASTDYGETWGDETLVCSDGAHPDITYGSNGYVYVAFETTGLTKGKSVVVDKEIWFRRNTNYCAPGAWGTIEPLTDDYDEDSYPKVAALHTAPEDTACIWVAYNHDASATGEWDTLTCDDDTASYYFPIPDPYGDDLFNVRFTPSWGYRLRFAQFLFFRKAGTGAVRIYVWADTSGYPAQKIDSVDIPHADIQLYPSWTTVSFLSKNTTFFNPLPDFHIGYTPLGPPATDTLSIISDNGEPAGTEHRSSEFSGGVWGTMYNDWLHDVNFMIRAVVERVTDPNTDLRFAYSTNSGKDWVKDQIIAGDADYDEMACNLHVYRSPSWYWLDLCYLRWPIMIRAPKPDICYTWSHVSAPYQIHSPHETLVDDYPYWSPDSREVCQIVFPPPAEYPGIVYAGAYILKENEEGLIDGAWNLYFDHHDWTDVQEEVVEEVSPVKFSLSANYPNPFNPTTRIQFTVSSSQFAVHSLIPTTLKVYNVLGQLVKTLVDEPKEAGTYEVTWDGKDENGYQVASGIYFYRLQAKDFVQTKKMVLMK